DVGGVGGGGAGALFIGADGDVDLPRHGGQFGLGLPQGLAGLSGDGLGHFGGALFQDGLIAFHRVDAVLARAVGPGGEGGAGGLDGGADLLDGGGFAFPDGFAGGGVGGGEVGHISIRSSRRTPGPSTLAASERRDERLSQLGRR